MRCVGALLDNAQKLHAARRRDISIVHHNERPSDMIQYFTTLRHNRPAHLLSSFIIYRQGNKGARTDIDFDATSQRVLIVWGEINIAS